MDRGQGSNVASRKSKVEKQRSETEWRSFAYGEGQFEFSQDLSARKRHEIPLGEHPMVLGSVRTQLDAALSPAIARSPGLNSSCDKAQEAQESVACKAAARSSISATAPMRSASSWSSTSSMPSRPISTRAKTAISTRPWASCGRASASRAQGGHAGSNRSRPEDRITGTSD